VFGALEIVICNSAKKKTVVEQNPALKADIPEGSGKLHNADEPDLETQIGS